MMLDIWQQLQSFMGRGGPVLWVILALLVLMWILMIERLLYLNLGFARCSASCLAAGRPVASATAGTLGRSAGAGWPRPSLSSIVI